MQGESTVAQRQTPMGQLAVIKPRVRMGLCVIAVLYLLLAGRLVYLQAARHSYFRREANNSLVVRHILPALRGRILDRNSVVLALDDPSAWAIFADPKMVKDPAGTAQALAPLLGMDPAKLQTLLTPRSVKDKTRYVSLRRHAPDALGPKVQALNLQGIGVIHDTRRVYPNHTLAAQVLGFTNIDGKGIEGVEESQDALLRGQDGIESAQVDSKGRIIPGTQAQGRAPQNGHDLVLTLDANLQNVADTTLAQAVKAHHAQQGVVVVLDPQTGDILALSPTYNPNKPRPVGPITVAQAAAMETLRRDHAVSDLYEPGSTLKTITASAVLQAQGLGMMDKYVYCSPTLAIGRHVIHEAADSITDHLGSQNLRGILRVSSNVGMAQFGLGLGADNLYHFEQAFGFLNKPDSGLPGETHSWLLSPYHFNRFTGHMGWSQIQLANISFGQGISVTPLQLADAYAAVANGGILMQPHILKAIDTNGVSAPVAPVPIRRVISPEVAAAVRSMLGTVVQSGTGGTAQIADFSVGGKTGSAQIAGPHGYEAGHFVSSFVGMYPLSHPRVVILCAVFNPQGVFWGATVAAPVVHDIGRYAMLEMHVPPDDPNAVDWADRGKVRRQQVASR
jgi:cell division protein FtsI/penicillin-binding protein 2